MGDAKLVACLPQAFGSPSCVVTVLLFRMVGWQPCSLGPELVEPNGLAACILQCRLYIYIYMYIYIWIFLVLN